MKEKVTAKIERDKDGVFCIGSMESFHNCMFVGDGDTIESAKADFMDAMKDLLPDVGIDPADVEVDFKYDVQSFLMEYKGILSLSGLQAITGINQRQLHHYLSGVRKPSASTISKIQKGIREYAERLSSVELA